MKLLAILVLSMALAMAFTFVAFEKYGSKIGLPKELPQNSSPQIVEPPKEESYFTDNYEKAISEKERKVILVFGAEWCAHCVKLKNYLKTADLNGYLVCFLNTEDRKDLRREYAVRSLPTSVMLKEGKEISRERGFDVTKYGSWIENNK